MRRAGAAHRYRQRRHQPTEKQTLPAIERDAVSAFSILKAGSQPITMRTASDAAPRILIADDQPDVLEALRLLLKGEGFRLNRPRRPPGSRALELAISTWC